MEGINNVTSTADMEAKIPALKPRGRGRPGPAAEPDVDDGMGLPLAVALAVRKDPELRRRLLEAVERERNASGGD